MICIAKSVAQCLLRAFFLIPFFLACFIAGEVLLELKLAFNATAQRLTSWRPSDPNPCGWEGISCSLPDLRVQSMCVPVA